MQLKQFYPQLLYWVFFIGLFTAVYASYDGEWVGTLLLNLIRLPFMAGIAYLAFHRNFNLPHLPNWIKIILILLSIVASAFLSRFIFGQTVFPVYFQGEYTFEFLNFSALFNQAFVMTAGVAGYGTMVYFLERSAWSQRREELIKEKKRAELNFFRAQVHPHFLFNTLNGIYAESLKESGKTPELILKLSDLLRFMLYECNRESIALRSEIKVIRDYMELEMLRYGKRLDVEFSLQAHLDQNLKIPPLIFLSLVENAFKHGVSAQMDRSYVKVSLLHSVNHLHFSVVNTAYTDQTDETGYQMGIGLSNVRRQLELIYGDHFGFSQKKENGIFKTELRIPLK